MDDNRRAVPRVRVSTLLVPLFYLALLAYTVRYGLYRQVALASIPLLPLAVAAPLTLVRWRSPHTPLTVVQWVLLVVLPLGTYVGASSLLDTRHGLGTNIVILLFSLLILGLIWFPQIAAVLVRFHAPPVEGLTIPGRFSLRTFLVGVTLLSIALAGVGLWVKSSYGMQYDLERITHFEPDWLFRMETSVSDRRDLEQKISQQLHDRIVSTLVARNYREVPLPLDLARRRYVREESEYQWTCYLRYMPDNEQVYVLMKTFDGKLISVESGTARVGWHNSRLDPAKPATQVEHKIVVDFLHALSSVWRQTIRSPNLLADAEAYVQQVEIANSEGQNQDD